MALLMIPIGRSKEELTEALNDAKTKTQSLTESAEERLPESAVTRFISMPDLAAPLVALGSLPVLDKQLQPLQQTCWPLDLKPMWAHHRYLTVRMKPN